MAHAKAQDDAMRAYVQDVAGSGSASPADELTRLAALRDQGAITDSEFEQLKAKTIG